TDRLNDPARRVSVNTTAGTPHLGPDESHLVVGSGDLLGCHLTHAGLTEFLEEFLLLDSARVDEHEVYVIAGSSTGQRLTHRLVNVLDVMHDQHAPLGQ